jgi:hypothetical protein
LLENDLTRDTVITGDDSAFVFRNAPVGHELPAGLVIEGDLIHREILPMLQPGQNFGPVEIDLEPVLNVSGHVFEDSTKQPLPGIKVEVVPHSSNCQGKVTAWTDESGFFDLPGIPAGKAEIGTVSDEYWNESKSNIDIDPAKPNPDFELFLRLPGGSDLFQFFKADRLICSCKAPGGFSYPWEERKPEKEY